MKPPIKDAINKALDILLESIREQNGYTFPSIRTVPLNDIPFEELTTHADVLNSAKSYLSKGADELISRIQLRRNLAAPIHRLPEEIFETILEMTENDRPSADIYDMLLLCRFGRLWHATILNCPRLWTRMDTNLSPKMARLVMRLSKGLALSLFGNAGGRRGGHPILDIAVQNSTRFKLLSLLVGLGNDPFDIKQLLTSPTPVLESLTVKVVPGRTYPEVVLSEGAPLKHLALTNFTLTIDPHRLSNLVTLSLHGSAVPASLGTLLQSLSISAQLEELEISNNTPGEEVPQPSPSVTLPRLKTLRIKHITGDYCMALLASIYTPACSIIYVDDEGSQHADSLDALVWKKGSIQASALLRINSSPEPQISGVPTTASIPQISTSISVSRSATRVRVEEKGHFRWRNLSFQRSEPLKLLKLIGKSLQHLLYPSSSSLVHSCLMSPHDLLDLRPWNSTLESLSLRGYAASLSAMQQLAQCIAAPSGAGVVATEHWMCPHLREIRLDIPKGEEEERAICIAALRSLVRKRWSGEDGDLSPAIQPDWFVIISHRSREFQDVEWEIKRIVPSFKLE